jgi:hypothetical protein
MVKSYQKLQFKNQKMHLGNRQKIYTDISPKCKSKSQIDT